MEDLSIPRLCVLPLVLWRFVKGSGRRTVRARSPRQCVATRGSLRACSRISSTSSALARPDVAVGAIRAGARASEKPLIAYVSPHAPHIVELLNREGVPAFAACLAGLEVTSLASFG